MFTPPVVTRPVTPTRCPQCRATMKVVGMPFERRDHFRLSIDHILPKERGGKAKFLYGDVRNTRIMCQYCNSAIAASGHCIGARACVRAVARATGRPESQIRAEWGLGRIIAGKQRRLFSPLRSPGLERGDGSIGGRAMSRPSPLPLMARRLAPAVACGLIGHGEALDTLMEIAASRGLLVGWERAHGLAEWLSATLHRETEAFRQRRRNQQPRRMAA